MHVFIGKSFNDAPTAELEKYEIESFEHFCEIYIRNSFHVGEKNENYFTIGDEYELQEPEKYAYSKSYKSKQHYRRENKFQKSAWLIAFDGDHSIHDDENCVPPKKIHDILKYYNLNHCVYTTYSHIPGIKNRWRLILPCHMTNQAQLKPTTKSLFKILLSGCPELKMANETKTWSQPWFFPTSDDVNKFEFYSYYNGLDFTAQQIEATPSMPLSCQINTTAEDMINIIRTGRHPLHETIRNYVYGAVLDGRSAAWIHADLKAHTEHYPKNDQRLQSRRNDIKRIIDETIKKYNVQSPDWSGNEVIRERYFTQYPHQGGVFEEIVKVCMNWMYYPNRQIAVTAAHALISTLGGRTYTLATGSGIVYTALITGRSTIGKSNVKKFCIHALNDLGDTPLSDLYIGSHYYTSVNNLIREMSKTGTLLSVRTESGQTDQSGAGDMKRLMLYELELATNSGSEGYVSSGGQNEKVPSLFSPAVTTIRESVAEIQSQADLLNQTIISGVAGRRSHVCIDPVKAPYNSNRTEILPEWFKHFVFRLHIKAIEETRRDVEKKLDDSAWVTIHLQDQAYYLNKVDRWLEHENKAAEHKDHILSTFFGRLGERTLAYAGRLAIADNPDNPRITNQHLDIAELSLTAEINAYIESDNLGDPWEVLTERIVKLFKGDIKKNLHQSARTNHKMTKAGCIEWQDIYQIVRKITEYKLLAQKDRFHEILTNKLEYKNIRLLKTDEIKRLFGRRCKVYQRI